MVALKSTHMRQIIGIVGSGMIGSDPWDSRCWSRSGFNLFTSLKQSNLLSGAYGVEVPLYKRLPIMAINYSPERRRWRQKFNLDAMYYQMLTNEIAIAAKKYSFDKNNAILQIGGHYNAAEATNIESCSYHDGNVAGLMQSPYFSKDLLKYARKAFNYEKRTYASMKKILVMSEYWKNSFIENFDVPSHKVVNVGFGVNISAPAQVNKDYLTKNIVFVGIDFLRKGGSTLINAFKEVVSNPRHKDAQLHIVGPKTIPEILSQPGLPSGINFHGFLSREVPEQKAKLESILEQGNIFVLPSLYEPFGNAGLEAMLFGMPVIAPNNWSFPDFVIPGETGILLNQNGNSEELSNAIINLLDSPDETKRMGLNGYQQVTSRYSWPNTIQNIAAAMDIPFHPL
jgi:alpha-maltose-1-phosphate synthase